MPAGYEELAMRFEPIRSGEIFEVHDNKCNNERLRRPGPQSR